MVMVSMKDIAKKCGVSVATVSKALNDHSDIGAQTKARIRMAADEMGYLPNSSARTLKTKRSYNIGVLFVDDDQSGLTHDFFSHILDSFKVTAESRGYDITFINRNTAGKVMTYYEHARYRGVDGVVIASVKFTHPEVQELIRSELPVVTIDHVFDNRTAILSDNVGGMCSLVNYIYEQGHRKIAYIHGNQSSVTKNRIASFYRTMSELGLEVPDEYVLAGEYRNTKLAVELTCDLLALKNRPTCIIYPDDFSAIGGLNAMKSLGLRVPEDISIAGYDGITIAHILEPHLTTVAQDTVTLGKCAANKLIELIESPKTSVIDHIVISGRLLEGQSVRRTKWGKER